MRNPVREPWRSAVLTEIGEYRRPGNVYTREDVGRGLEEFKAVLSTYPAPGLAIEEPVEEALPVADRAFPTREVAAMLEGLTADSVKSHYLEYSNRRL